MDRIVVDTNIFVSGTATGLTPPSKIINAWRNDTFILVTSPQILIEVKEVLLRPKIMTFTNLSAAKVEEYVYEIGDRAFITEGKLEVKEIENDPDDNIILACAVEGKATHIITGDTKSLLPLKEYQGIKILTASEYINAHLQ